MSETSDWTTERCEKHDIVSCADCLGQKRMRRDANGEVRYQGDCTVDTFREITGTDYDFASEVLREAGFVPGAGTRMIDLLKAFESVGFKVTDVTHLGLDGAKRASRDGSRDFYVAGVTVGRQNRDGHAWTIQNGREARDFLRNRKIYFKIFEVTA